nr:HNH endonuclease domain-containing protein [Hymenobacter telluris]
MRQSSDYDLDHLLPLAVYPVNELWNLVPVDREFNQRIKRDRVPFDQRLREAEPWLAEAYRGYDRSCSLRQAVQEDAALRFSAIQHQPDFAAALGQQAVEFSNGVAAARYVMRF